MYVSACIVEFPRMSRHRHMNRNGGAPEARFFFPYLSVSLTTNPESVAGLRVLSYLLSSVTCSKSSELLTYLLVGPVPNLCCFTHCHLTVPFLASLPAVCGEEI